MLSLAAHQQHLRLRPPSASPRPALLKKKTTTRYTSGRAGEGGAGGASGDRFAETVLFTSADRSQSSLTSASQAVMMALLEKRVPFRHALVRPSGDSEFADLFSAVNPGAPFPLPPLLADCGAIVAGNGAEGNSSEEEEDGGNSARVLLEYLCERYRSVGTPLLPSNAGAAATVRLFSDVFSEAVGKAFYRFLRANDDESLARARAEFMEGWRRVDAFLLAHGRGATAGFDALDSGAELLFGQHRSFVVRPPEAAARAAAAAQAAQDGERDEGTLEGDAAPSGDAFGEPAVDRDSSFSSSSSSDGSPARPPPQGAYLLGRAYSLAEVAATPLVARMAARLPSERAFDLAGELRREGLHRSADWCEACLARPSAVATAATADEMVGAAF